MTVSISWKPSGRFPRMRRERLILAGESMGKAETLKTERLKR
jgi:hypothetical protein